MTHRKPMPHWELTGPIETLLSRAQHLPPSDQALLEQVLGRGVRTAELARAAGLHPRLVQRRVRYLIARLTDPRVPAILQRCRNWPTRRRKIALRWWLAGQSQPQIAADLGLTIYQVRQHLLAARALAEEQEPEPQLTAAA